MSTAAICATILRACTSRIAACSSTMRSTKCSGFSAGISSTRTHAAGAYEAWLIDRDGHVTEGSSTTAWIVDAQGRLITRDLDNAILPGVTRRILIAVAESAQMPIQQRRFTQAEAQGAREAF